MRNVLLGIAVLGARVTPVAADARQPGSGTRIRMLVPGTPATWDGYVEVLRLRLHERGWIDEIPKQG